MSLKTNFLICFFKQWTIHVLYGLNRQLMLFEPIYCYAGATNAIETKLSKLSTDGQSMLIFASASIRLGAAASSEGPSNNLFSARNVSQLHGNGRNRSTFFQKQELSLFRSHWQACKFSKFIFFCNICSYIY